MTQEEKKLPDVLAEAAEQYADGPECAWVGKSALVYAFKAGAEWQKAKMMEEAIHYVVQDDLDSHGVSYNIPFIRIGKIALKPKGIGVGDKVKIIIIKEDER